MKRMAMATPITTNTNITPTIAGRASSTSFEETRLQSTSSMQASNPSARR
ncbi:hypothetical protein [Hyphomonas sp.]|nr:hypothetical protein [Hyphomonas sp.]